MALIQGTNACETFSSSNSSRGPKGSFFKDGVQTQLISAPKEGHSLEVIILPSFDMAKGPSDFKTSYVPYREQNSDLLDPITKTPAFTSWAKSCKAYSYFGNSKQNFVSPLTGKAYRGVKSKRDNKLRYYPPAHIDPIVDIANYIFFNKEKVDPATLRLITREEGQVQALPRAPKSFVLSNALVSIDGGDWQFKVIAYSEMAYIDLINILAQMTGRSQVGVSPNFEDYLFGDITDPITGTILSVSLKSGNGISFAGFNVSSDNRTLSGRKPIPQNLVNENILAKRVILNDTDYLDVWSYQQIVDFLVEDGVVPINIIRDGTKPGTIVEPKESFKQEEPTHQFSSAHSQINNSSVQQNISFLGSPHSPTLQSPAVHTTHTTYSNSELTEVKEESIPQSNSTNVDVTNDPQFEVYRNLFKTVSSGKASGDDVMNFLELQKKFGPIAQYEEQA